MVQQSKGGSRYVQCVLYYRYITNRSSVCANVSHGSGQRDHLRPHARAGHCGRANGAHTIRETRLDRCCYQEGRRRKPWVRCLEKSCGSQTHILARLSWTHLYEAFGEVLGYDKDKWADLEDIDNEVSDTDGDLDDIDIDANADADAEDVELATDTGEDNDSGEDDEDFIPVDMEAELGDNTETRFADGVDGFVTRDDLGNYLDGFQN